MLGKVAEGMGVLERHLVTLVQQAIAREKPLSVLVLDIDHFKAINDHHGHQAGDHVLVQLATLAMSMLGEDDVFARYGGEEFAIILSDTDLDGALVIANACRTHLAALAIENPAAPGARVTMSIGVASIVPTKEGSAAGLLLARADKALYAAKQSGRNRVCIADAELA